MTERPLMPKATAVWLVDNTLVTFKQVADFTGLHPLEVQAIADGDVAANILGKNPILRGLLSQKNVDAAAKDPDVPLVLLVSDMPQAQRRSKGPKYTAVTKRADKPNGIAYLVKNYPDITDAQIGRLIGTTKNTIQKIRDRTHASMSTISPQDPVQLGLCKRAEFEELLEKNRQAAERKAKKAERDAKKKAAAATSDKADKDGGDTETSVPVADVAEVTSTQDDASEVQTA